MMRPMIVSVAGFPMGAVIPDTWAHRAPLSGRMMLPDVVQCSFPPYLISAIRRIRLTGLLALLHCILVPLVAPCWLVSLAASL